MITAEANATTSILVGNVVVSLDQDYTVEVTKTCKAGNPTEYSAVYVDEKEVSDPVKDLIQQTVKNHCTKVGLW